MAENKTKQNEGSVTDFLNAVQDEQKRKDSFAVLKMMQEATGETPKMWGASLIGFGFVRIKSPATGREVDWFKIGFSPRKANLSLYLNGKLLKDEKIMSKLGKHKTGVGCLYINKLSDVDLKLLKEMIEKTAKMDYSFTMDK
ncbi:MAG: DUF1801 domain-containing protein [Bacteroidetes bacterium]|nr:DUF1801 domain-containing protein [Bacteroidota bacterium]